MRIIGKSESGFTLIEMMMVIGIIVLLAGIAVPNYITHRDKQKLNRGAREIYATFKSAKMNAIKDSTTIFITFTAGAGAAGTYRVWEDENGDGAFNAGDREVSDGQMNPGIALQNISFSGDSTAVFNSMGLPRMPTGALDFGSLEVTNGTETRTVTLNNAGSVRID